jgi:DNA modification methylase
MANKYIKKPTRSTMDGRWATFGPYYAMFPVEFALNVIYKYTNEGDYILDPFSGRGTTVFASEMLNRHSIGIETNPVGWIYSQVKLNPTSKNRVIKRLLEINLQSLNEYKSSYETYPDFFNMCFDKKVLNFLICARDNLDWKNKKIDRTLMAFLVNHLHGHLGKSLSNQMQPVKSCGMEYAIKWWKEKNLTVPPKIDYLDYLIKRINWRYEKGFPKYKNSKVFLNDNRIVLKRKQIKKYKFKLLLTSPPYYNITDYFQDQWLRLWLLGGKNRLSSGEKFQSKEKYYNLLYNVFAESKKLLESKAIIYIRTDKREFTKKSTINILEELFPEKDMTVIDKPFNSRTQTFLHGDTRKKPGEIDIILQ